MKSKVMKVLLPRLSILAYLAIFILCLSLPANAQSGSCSIANLTPLLSSSSSRYAAANNNTLVEVTEAEFRNVQALLNSARFVGWDPDTIPSTHDFAGEYVEVLDESPAIVPANKVLVGFFLDVSGVPNQISPRIGTPSGTGMTVRLSWPDASVSTVGEKWFVIKNPTGSISTDGYLGLHRTNAVRGWKSGVNGLYVFDLGNPAFVSSRCNCGQFRVFGIYADRDALCNIASEVAVTKTLVGESTARNNVAEPAEELTYEVRITHKGGGPFSDFDFVENIPDGTTLTAVTGASGFTGPVRGPAAVNLRVAQVPVGGTVTVTIKLETIANFPASISSITNRVGGGDVPADCSQCSVTIPTPTRVPTSPPTLSCSSSGNFLNTAYDGNGGRLTSGTDSHWGVAMTSSNVTGQPPPNLNYTAATVYTGTFLQAPVGPAGWITHNAGGGHVGSVDVFYRYQFNLDGAVDPRNLALNMRFNADNAVYEVWVNGVAQGIRSGFGSGDPYQYIGFDLANPASGTMQGAWQTGLNTIIVHVKSSPGTEAFLAYITTTAICLPKLTLRKDVVNDNGGTIAESAFTLRAAGPATIQGVMGTPAITNATVPIGTYALSETGPAGYSGSQYACSVDGRASVLGNTITLANGQNAVCTITNDDIAPRLTLVAQVINDNGGSAVPGDVGLSATGPTPISGPSGSARVTNAAVNAGSYTLDVTAPPNYEAGDYSCMINGGAPVAGNSITLSLADIAVCTVTVEDMNPMVTIAKVSVGGVGRFGFAGAAANANGFPIDGSYEVETITPGVAVEGASVPLAAADVETRIVEAIPAGWVLESARCEDRRAAATGNPAGQVIGTVSDGKTLVIPAGNARAGADLLCTFTNRFRGFAVEGRVILDNGAGGGMAHNRIQDGAEEGQGTVLLRLTDCGSTEYDRGVSDGAGQFSISLAKAPAGTTVCLERGEVPGHLPVSLHPGDTGGASPEADKYEALRFTPAAETNHQGVVFGLIVRPRLATDSRAVVAPGGAALLPHRYTATTTASVLFALTGVTGTPDAALFSTTIYRDADCSGSIDAGDWPVSAPIAVAAGDVICLFVRVQASVVAPEGGTLDYMLSATTALSGTSASLSPAINRDTVSVGTGTVAVTRRVRNVTQAGSYGVTALGAPGDVLEYSVIFINPSASSVSGVRVHDETPDYTTLDAPIKVKENPTGLDCQPALPTASAAVDYKGPLRWDCTGTMSPGAKGEVSFKVKIDH